MNRPLDYRSARDEPRRFSVVLLVATIVFAAGTVVCSVFFAVTVSIILGHAGPGVLVLLGAAALLVGLGFYGHRKPVRRPFALGIWIGTAAGLLILAVVFVRRAYWR